MNKNVLCMLICGYNNMHTYSTLINTTFKINVLLLLIIQLSVVLGERFSGDEY